ncbi:TPA_asm: HlyD family efflux transporter periplasmic adaptor subunit [Salmonella enterica subsp. enterica serovar Typhimurium]|nr:HlyD family efflux transporter periplasmic adaptor subunit [Salmonella enterica subsp. enterica serovar Typhimurium]
MQICPVNNDYCVVFMFRKDFFLHKKNEWLGDVHISNPVSYRLLGLYCFILFLTFIMFLFFAHYTHREKSQGSIIPENGIININSNDNGFIKDIYISNGSHIKKGEPLFSISKEKNAEQYGNTNHFINKQLEKQKNLLIKTINDKKYFLDTQKKIKIDYINELKNDKAEIKNQLLITQKQSLKMKSILLNMQKLKIKGYVSKLEIQQQENLFLENEKQIKSLKRQLIENTMKLNEQEDFLNRIYNEYKIEENKINQDIFEIEKNMAINKNDEQNIYFAKEDGVVSSLLFEKGQSIKTGDTVIAVIPENSKFVIQLFLPSNSIGFIKPGNNVALRYQAYPYQKFGIQHGKVKEISKSITSAKQITDITGNPSNEPYYRIIVEPEKQFIDTYDEQKKLIPGMIVDADIMLEKRNIFEWIFEPMFGLKNKYLN